jgi:superfamily II DNA or RNA helicase
MNVLETLAGDGRFAYQVPLAKTLAAALDTHRGALNASGMGVGKTHSSLAACLLLKRPVAVLCPKPCVAGWQRAFEHFDAKPVFIGGFEEVKRGSRHYNRNGWQTPAGMVLIVDEAHNCKGFGTANSKLLADAWADELHVLMLSATPFENPSEMWATGQVLGLHDGSPQGYEEWLGKMGCQWNDQKMQWWFPERERYRLEAIRAHIFDGQPPRGVRVTVESLGEAFPPSNVKFVEVELQPAERAKIDAAWKACNDIVARLEQQRAAPYIAMRMRQNAWAKAYETSQTSKAAYLLERIPNGIDAGFSVPVFCNYTSTREAIMRGLGTKCGIYGGQKPEVREAHRLDFQQDRERSIICQIQSGGTGLDLHDIESVYPRFAFVLPCPKWSLVEQAKGRVRRAGGGPSDVRIIYAKGTVEETMCRKQRERVANMRALVGDTYQEGEE